MPAIIQNTPVFTPFSFEQYIAPLNAYKQEYDAVEKQYNEVEAAASALEALAADDPHSQAYRTYRNYADRLRAEADALAYNGLTPGSRQRLRNIRSQYTTDIIPIVRGMEKWEKEKARYDNLKDGEIMSNNPYTSGVDYYIGANPSSRVLNLERVRKDAQLIGQAWSQRIWDDMSPVAINTIMQTTQEMQSQLQGMIHNGPEGQDSFKELKNAQLWLNENYGPTNPESEGINLLVNQLESLGYDTFDTNGKKQILNAIIMGYGQGLEGVYHQNRQSLGSVSSSKNTKQFDIHPTQYQLLPLDKYSQAAQDVISTLGGVQDKNGDFKFNTNKHFKLTINNDPNKQEYVSWQEVFENYKEIQNGTYKRHQGQKHSQYTVESYDINHINKVLDDIEKYNPTVAADIRTGKFTGNIEDVINDIFKQLQEVSSDYAARLYTVQFTDEQDGAYLSQRLRDYLISNNGQVQFMDIDGTGKVFTKTREDKIDGVDQENKSFNKDIKVTGVNFLATDPNSIIVNTQLGSGEDVEYKSIRMPVTAINKQYMETMQEMYKVTNTFNTFTREHGTFEGSKPGETPTDMQYVFDTMKRVANTADLNTLKGKEALLTELQKLAIDQGKNKDYYTQLWLEYQNLSSKADLMYHMFVQNAVRATNTINSEPTKQSGGIPI